MKKIGTPITSPTSTCHQHLCSLHCRLSFYRKTLATQTSIDMVFPASNCKQNFGLFFFKNWKDDAFLCKHFKSFDASSEANWAFSTKSGKIRRFQDIKYYFFAFFLGVSTHPFLMKTIIFKNFESKRRCGNCVRFYLTRNESYLWKWHIENSLINILEPHFWLIFEVYSS